MWGVCHLLSGKVRPSRAQLFNATAYFWKGTGGVSLAAKDFSSGALDQHQAGVYESWVFIKDFVPNRSL